MNFRPLIRKTGTLRALFVAGNLGRIGDRFRRNFRLWRLQRAHGRPFVYRLNRVPMVCVPGIAESEETFLSPEVDVVELEILQKWLQPGDLFVDVGANLGMYTFSACHYLRGDGHFLAIEASPHLVGVLQSSARLLGAKRVEFVQSVVGDRIQEIDFYLAPPNRSTGQQSLHPAPALREYQPQRMQMETLTDIMRRSAPGARPAAVKLDIEGAEPLALRGAPDDWLGADGPLWVVELNPTVLARSESSCLALVQGFPASAFDRWLVPHHAIRGARYLPMRALADGETFGDAWFYNLVAIPRGDRWGTRRRDLPVALASPQ